MLSKVVFAVQLQRRRRRRQRIYAAQGLTLILADEMYTRALGRSFAPRKPCARGAKREVSQPGRMAAGRRRRT